MACRAVRQRPLNSLQMVLQQNATLFGDAVANCESTKCKNERVGKLVITKRKINSDGK